MARARRVNLQISQAPFVRFITLPVPGLVSGCFAVECSAQVGHISYTFDGDVMVA